MLICDLLTELRHPNSLTASCTQNTCTVRKFQLAIGRLGVERRRQKWRWAGSDIQKAQPVLQQVITQGWSCLYEGPYWTVGRRYGYGNWLVLQ